MGKKTVVEYPKWLVRGEERRLVQDPDEHEDAAADGFYDRREREREEAAAKAEGAPAPATAGKPAAANGAKPPRGAKPGRVRMPAAPVHAGAGDDEDSDQDAGE